MQMKRANSILIKLQKPEGFWILIISSKIKMQNTQNKMVLPRIELGFHPRQGCVLATGL